MLFLFDPLGLSSGSGAPGCNPLTGGCPSECDPQTQNCPPVVCQPYTSCSCGDYDLDDTSCGGGSSGGVPGANPPPSTGNNPPGGGTSVPGGPGMPDEFQSGAGVMDSPWIFHVTSWGWPWIVGAAAACVAEPWFCVGGAILGSVIMMPSDVAHHPKAVPVPSTKATTGSDFMDAIQQLAKDLKACAEQYPPGPEREECFKQATIRFRLRKAPGAGGVQ